MTGESKIRLLVFTPTLQCGGTEKFVSVFCSHLDKEKFTICLAVLDNANPFYVINDEKITVADLRVSRVRYSLFRIRKFIREFQPDVVFSTANHLNLFFAVFRNWFPAQVKFVARESSIVSINSQRAAMPALYNRLVKKYYRRFDLLVCQSIYMQQDLVKHYNVPAAKTVVVYNAVSTAFVKPAAAGKSGLYKLITVARLSEEKGIERLIHAVGLLSLPFHFYVIGDGDKKQQLQQLVNELQLNERISFSGQQRNPFAGMEDANLYLSGSYYEGLPNALLEAQALGIPVIAFDVPGGIGEIVVEGENGLLVEDNDLIGFAAAIKRALEMNFDRNRIIENTQNRFSVEGMIKKMEELLLLL